MKANSLKSIKFHIYTAIKTYQSNATKIKQKKQQQQISRQKKRDENNTNRSQTNPIYSSLRLFMYFTSNEHQELFKFSAMEFL